jgi:hypothetical protein
MSPYYTGRDNYYKLPTYPLKGVNIAPKDYQNGPLENWTTGALHFNGRDQYAVLPHEDIDAPSRPQEGQREPEPHRRGADLRNPHLPRTSPSVYLRHAGIEEWTLIQKIGRRVGPGVNEAGRT